MPTSKRARELARAKHGRQMERRAERRAHRRVLTIVGVTLGGIVAVAIALALTIKEDRSAQGGPTAMPTPSDVTCTDAQARPQSKTFASAGDEHLQEGASITFDTSCGPIKVALDVTQAPQTANAIAFLANRGWYDGNGCHRLTTAGIFVLQCGSPTLDGKGGPGFKIPDENLPADMPNNYPAGTVAMANSGPGTAGSQIFLVYQDTTLPSSYTILGNITSGLDVVEYVAAKGVKPGSPDARDGPPAQAIVIAATRVEA